MRLLLLILTTLYLSQLSGSISFKNINIDEAVRQATKENKLVFVDTYAIWCNPCKQMDEVFNDQNLGDFINDHFISVKIDMDSPYGKEIGTIYNVVWLPTLIILNTDGAVKNKIDKIVDAQELMHIAQEAVRTEQQYIEQDHMNHPFGNGSAQTKPVKELITEDNAPILYVYDERASSGRPHIIYHEAYLHMMLMDGKQHQVARKYLSTQSDWSTDKNIKFIFDFLDKTNSPEFEFFIEHQDRFIEVLGVEQVAKTMSILSYERLYNGFPRPELDEAITLLSHTDPTHGKSKAYQYYINRLYHDKQFEQLNSYAIKYLLEINPYDHKIMYQYSYSLLSQNSRKINLSECLKWAKKAIIYDDSNPRYHLHLANLYYLMSDRVSAKIHCNQALILAQDSGINTAEMIKLQNKLMKL